MDTEAVHAVLASWEAFYIIVGSVAGALTGLQFVVMALIAERGAKQAEVAAFGTPNVLHFCAALLVAALLSAPWPSFGGPAASLAIAGFAGAVYVLIVIRRARRQKGYRPVLEDWIWHAVLPFAAYAGLGVAALCLTRDPRPALSVVAVASLLLTFIGIHNAWDTITFIATDLTPAAGGGSQKG